jgi:hypothetical protein
MTDRSAFTDDEWKALTEVPLRITLALVAVGPHGPISVVKEAAASASVIRRGTSVSAVHSSSVNADRSVMATPFASVASGRRVVGLAGQPKWTQP